MRDVWDRASPVARRKLRSEQKKVLYEGSGISRAVAKARGYYTMKQAAIEKLVANKTLDRKILDGLSWMGIPIHRPDGSKHGEIVRVFGGSGKAKYIWPSGRRNAADVNPLCRDRLGDRSVPIIVTEGIKKADAVLSAALAEGFDCVVVGINGNWGWRSREDGGGTALPDFQDIPWEDRTVYVIVDSDYRTNDDVRKGWLGCASYLSSKSGAKKALIVIPPANGLAKVGADDYLVAGNSLADLLGQATTPAFLADEDYTSAAPIAVSSAFQVIRKSRDEVPHLVYPLLPERSILLMAGHSGSYKTWNGLQFALDGAFGMVWANHPKLRTPTRPFRTLYLNKEMGSELLGSRLRLLVRDEKYKKHPNYREALRENLIVADQAEIDLASPLQRKRLEELIDAYKVDLVVLDSLSMSWTGDENSASEVAGLFIHMRGITQRVGCSWMPIHHLVKGGGKNREPNKFTVRGSGQIIQQADSAVMLSNYEAPEAVSSQTELMMSHVKARTTQELPSWLTKFDDNDGKYCSMEYTGNVSEVRATAYSKSHGDPKLFEAWITEELLKMPVMQSGAAGLRSQQLLVALKAAWPHKNPPGDSTIRRRITQMVTDGMLDITDTNARLGNLYVLNENYELKLSGEYE